MMENTEYESKKKLFDMVKNPENWKLPTIPYETDSYVMAHAVAEAIIFFTGGAKISSIGMNPKLFTVESKGYYHHIGG